MHAGHLLRFELLLRNNKHFVKTDFSFNHPESVDQAGTTAQLLKCL